jgi:hypothetical protein
VTFKEMSDFVVNTLGLQDIDSYDETAMVAMWLNQGIIDILSRTRAVVRCVQLNTQNGVDTYTLDHNILSIVDSEAGPDYGYSDSRRYRAARNEWPINPSFVLIRSDVIQIIPTPDADGITVQVWAVLKPTAMAADADDPADEQFGALPYEFHDAPILYALWKCADYGDDSSSQQGERYRMIYEGTDGRGGRLGQIRTMVNKRGTSIPVRRRVRMQGLSSSGTYVGG